VGSEVTSVFEELFEVLVGDDVEVCCDDVAVVFV
jgi:hypothetical protein